jgi:hypothetical protein
LLTRILVRSVLPPKVAPWDIATAARCVAHAFRAHRGVRFARYATRRLPDDGHTRHQYNHQRHTKVIPKPPQQPHNTWEQVGEAPSTTSLHTRAAACRPQSACRGGVTTSRGCKLVNIASSNTGGQADFPIFWGTFLYHCPRQIAPKIARKYCEGSYIST